MKKLINSIATLVVCATVFTACSTIKITDSQNHSRTIQIKEHVTVSNNLVEFESIHGTHYHVPLNEYNFVVK